MPVHLPHLPWPDSARWFVLYGGIGEVPLQNLTGKTRLAEFQGAIPGRPTRSAFEITLIGKEIGELAIENEQPIYILRQSTIGTVELRAFGTVVGVNMDRPGMTKGEAGVAGYETRWRISCSTVYRKMQNTFMPDDGYLRSEEEYAADRLSWFIDAANEETNIQLSFPLSLRLTTGILFLAPDDLDQKYQENLGGQSIADAINEICAYGEMEWAFDKPTLTGYSNPPEISDPMAADWWPVLDENPARTTIRVWSAIDGPPAIQDEEEGPALVIVNTHGFDTTAFPQFIPAREMNISVDTDNVATQARVFYKGGSVVVDLDPDELGVFPIRITTFDTLSPEAATSIGRTQLAVRCRPDRNGQAIVPYHPRWKPGSKVSTIQAHDWVPGLEYFAARTSIIRDVSLQWSENDAGDPTWATLTFGNDPYIAPSLPRPVRRADGGDDIDVPGLNDLRSFMEKIADSLNQGGNGVAQVIGVFNGNGTTIPAGSQVLIPIAFAAQVENWRLLADDAIEINVERGTSLLVYDDISGTGNPALGAGGLADSETPPADWLATRLAAGNIIRMTVLSADATNATLSINLRKQ